MLLSQVLLYMPGTPEDPVRASFNWGVQTVCALFGRLARKDRIELGQFRGISVECVKQLRGMTPSIAIGILGWEYQVDIEPFEQADSKQKKILTFGLLQAVLGDLSKIQGWSPTLFKPIFSEMERLGLANSYYWKKGAKWSPNRKLRAEVLINHEVDYCDLILEIFERSGKLVHRESLIRRNPDELVFSVHLGQLSWKENSEVILIPRVPHLHSLSTKFE